MVDGAPHRYQVVPDGTDAPGFVQVRVWPGDDRSGPPVCVRVRFDDPWRNYGTLLTAPADRIQDVFALQPMTPGRIAALVRAAHATGWAHVAAAGAWEWSDDAGLSLVPQPQHARELPALPPTTRWATEPSQAQVHAAIARFVELLHQTDLAGAHALVDHAHTDWDRQIWSLWQTTYVATLTDREPDDERFGAGRWWTERGWLARLTGGNLHPGTDARCRVELLYDGVLTDLSAEFSVVRTPTGFGLLLERIGRS